jgi:hypothetical protein
MSGFGNDGAETAMAKPFLETGEQRLFVTGLDMDQTIGLETGLRDRRRKEVGSGHNPEHLAFRARSDPGREHGGGRAVDGAIAATGDLMQAPQAQPAARQASVHVRQAEWQNLADTASTVLQVRNTLLKLGDDRVCRAIGHENPVLLRAFQRRWALLCSLFVPFPIMSQSGSCESLSGVAGDVMASNGAVFADCR